MVERFQFAPWKGEWVRASDYDALEAQVRRMDARFRDGVREEADGTLTLVWTQEELEQARDKAAKICDAWDIKRKPTRSELQAKIDAALDVLLEVHFQEGWCVRCGENEEMCTADNCALAALLEENT